MSSYKLTNLDIKGDSRGSLISLEENHNIPFAIKRVYYIFDTKKDVSRGFHAHIDLKQMAICVKGNCTFILDDGKSREEIKLNSPSQGLLLEGLIWREMCNFSPDCVLVVLASEHYDIDDYIRNYASFLEEVKNAN